MNMTAVSSVLYVLGFMTMLALTVILRPGADKATLFSCLLVSTFWPATIVVAYCMSVVNALTKERL